MCEYKEAIINVFKGKQKNLHNLLIIKEALTTLLIFFQNIANVHLMSNTMWLIHQLFIYRLRNPLKAVIWKITKF